MVILTLFLAALAHFLTIVAVGVLGPVLWRRNDIFDLFLAFGAGILLSAAFLHMLPAAITSLGASAGFYVLIGFLVMVFLEAFTMAHPCAEHDCPNHRVGWTAFTGLSIHSLIAGVALGVKLSTGADLSVSLAMLSAILIHKIPETLALIALLKEAKWEQNKIYLVIFLYALMGPLGILAGAFNFAENALVLGIGLSISTGTFLHIASSDLLPNLHKKMRQKWINFIAFVFGLVALSFEAIHHLHR